VWKKGFFYRSQRNSNERIRMSSIQIIEILKAAIKKGASDVHIRVGKPPTLRLHGRLVELNTASLNADDTVSVMKMVAKEPAQVAVQNPAQSGADFALALDGDESARFRVSLFREQGGLGLVFRRLPNRILTAAEVGYPKRILELATRNNGLILVTGPTGSGKTTSLASIVEYLLTEKSGRHIVTIEEPTEYRYAQRKGSVVTQREVPTDVPDFKEGLRQALRQDPDVILVGEMRDLETTRTALSAAETGHIVFATLHTKSAAKTIDRLVEQFPSGEHNQVRSQVSTCLLGVLCQQLLPRATNDGVQAAFEFMECTPAISNLIRLGKTEQIDSTIKTSGKAFGMQLLDDHLLELFAAQKVNLDDALAHANNPEQLRTRLRSTST
jgi:twitching motility protein PilT